MRSVCPLCSMQCSTHSYTNLDLSTLKRYFIDSVPFSLQKGTILNLNVLSSSNDKRLLKESCARGKEDMYYSLTNSTLRVN